MCTAALFTIAKIWKQAKCPRKKKILMFATTWMDLEGIMLGEISQRKTNTAWYHLYADSKYKVKLIETVEKWLPGTGGGGWGIERDWKKGKV